MTLREMKEHFFRLYGRRNRIFLSGLGRRINFLNLAIGDLQEAIRKGHNTEILEISLARVVARIFCIAENFQSLPLVESMARKFPIGHCSYCQKSPCACSERRSDAILVKLSAKEQFQWSLKDWCDHFSSIYGEKNRQKGIENMLNRLFKEIAEIMSLEMVVYDVVDMPQSLDKIEEEFALEIGDAFAWTIAIANVLEIDLEAAVLKRFGQGCWKCKQISCICTGFNVCPVRWEKLKGGG